MRIILPAVLLVLNLLAPARGDELKADLPSLWHGPSPIEAMVGEDLSYDIAFLWFDHLATAKLSFARGESPNTYRAILEARTLGVAAWLSRDRVQRYVSEMEVGPDGRLRALSYEARIIKRKGKELRDTTNYYTFDYQKRQVRYQRARDEKFYKDVTFPMAEGEPPNDFLTASYNFRAGFFGPVAAGARYVIPTFSRDGNGEMVVEILPHHKRPDHSFFPRDGLLSRVILDQEVFDTGGGMIYVWFDDYGRPGRGIVQNVIGLGDVRGRLR